jgi:hypothetical protein
VPSSRGSSRLDPCGTCGLSWASRRRAILSRSSNTWFIPRTTSAGGKQLGRYLRLVGAPFTLDIRDDEDPIRIATHWVATGTHTGTAPGLSSPSGKRIEVSGVTLVRLEGDKIAEGWDDYDHPGLMRQLGAV